MVHEGHGQAAGTTNNRMELTAVIKGLQQISPGDRVEVWTDSKYICENMTQGHVRKWRERGWGKRSGSSLQNVDLWKVLMEEADRHRVEWKWVKGHDGNAGNEEADRLAGSGARRALETCKKLEEAVKRWTDEYKQREWDERGATSTPTKPRRTASETRRSPVCAPTWTSCRMTGSRRRRRTGRAVRCPWTRCRP